jgi:hypothetical protein
MYRTGGFGELGQFLLPAVPFEGRANGRIVRQSRKQSIHESRIWVVGEWLFVGSRYLLKVMVLSVPNL